MKLFYRRYIEITALFGLVLSILVYLFIDAGQRQRTRNQFQQEMERSVGFFIREMKSYLDTVHFLKNFFQVSDNLSEEQFRGLMDGIIASNDSLAQLAWLPRVTAEERSSFELSGQLVSQGFEIRQQQNGEQPASAAQRAEYFPIYFITPFAGHKEELGLDIAFDKRVGEALRGARLTGDLVMLHPPVGENGNKDQIQIFAPVYFDQLESESERFNRLQGFVAAVFSLDPIMQTAFAGETWDGVRIRLMDISDAVAPSELYLIETTETAVQALADRFTRPLPEIGGKRWAIEAIPTISYLQARKTVVAELVLLFGLAFTALISVYMIMIAKREAKIQEIVDERTKELNALNQKLELMTLTDALTGVVNRRGLDQVLEIEWSRSVRERISLTLMIIDVDYFKLYNDHYGHIAGDECLKKVAQAIADVPMRLGDLVARYGGEEFAVMLPNTDDRENIVANRCRLAVEALGIKHGYSPISSVITVSIGVVTLWPQQDSSYVSLIRAADEAMYRAKSEGRNRVVRAQVDPSREVTS